MIDNTVRYLVVGILVLIMIFTAFQGILPHKEVEHFSELAILGPDMKMADYPRELKVNENFTLYLYIGNYEGEVTYYRTLVKLGNRSTLVNETIPMEAPTLFEYERILKNNGTWTYPMKLRITKPGINLRLVFEMWIYDVTLNDFRYHGRWNQLWLNVTANESDV